MSCIVPFVGLPGPTGPTGPSAFSPTGPTGPSGVSITGPSGPSPIGAVSLITTGGPLTLPATNMTFLFDTREAPLTAALPDGVVGQSVRLRLLEQASSPATITTSLGQVELDPTNPERNLFWNGSEWLSIKDNLQLAFLPGTSESETVGTSGFNIVSISTDGLIVASPVDGATIQIIGVEDPSLTQQIAIPAPPGDFLTDIDQSADGSILIIGAGLSSQVFVFTRAGSTYTLATTLSGGTGFGYGVALSSDGARSVISQLDTATNIGQVSYYVDIAGTATLLYTSVTTDIFGLDAASDYGFSVDISADGEMWVAGAPLNAAGTGAVVVGRNIDGWNTYIPFLVQGLNATGQFGFSISISADSEWLAVGAPTASVTFGGSTFQGGIITFIQLNKINGQSPYADSFYNVFETLTGLGTTLSLSADGSVLLTAQGPYASDTDNGLLYKNNGTTWNLARNISVSPITSVSLSGNGKVAAIAGYNSTTGASHVVIIH